MMVKMVQEAMKKKLKEKDEDIQCLWKLNWILQEKVKNFNMKNQIWKELAQNNLEQELANVSKENHHHNKVTTEIEF